MNTDRHLWEYRWARDLLSILTAIAVVSLVYQVRAVLVPVLIGLGAAYVVNPLVTTAKDRWKIARSLTTTLLLATGLLVSIGLVLYIVPKLAYQFFSLLENLPPYLERASEHIGINWANLTDQAQQTVTPDTTAPNGTGEDTRTAITNLTDRLNITGIIDSLGNLLGAGIGVVGTAVGSAFYLGLVAVVGAFSFFVFSVHFNDIVAWFGTFISPQYRDQSADVFCRMDETVSAFVRGRLIQSLAMAIILTVGWSLAGVPYWLLLGLIGGLLNLVPYAASTVWLGAIGLTWIDALSGNTGMSVVGVFVLPSLVYFVGQIVDGWVIEPIVQSKATNMNPLTVLLAVLIGGSLAGVLGMMLAIPAAACIKILTQELLLPRLRATGGA